MKNNKPQEKMNSAIRIAFIYAVFGGLWILFSDKVLATFVSDPETITQMQTYKGWFYILVTGILVYLLVRGSELKINKYLKQLSEKNTELTEEIGERKKAENERKNVLRKLALKNRELQSIVYITSHDLRSPLVNIMGFSGELQSSLSQLQAEIGKVSPESLRNGLLAIINGELIESVNFIETSGKKIDSLLKALLEVSRLGQRELTIEKVDMNEMMATVVESMQYQIESQNGAITVDELPCCKGDAFQINQLFSNLIDNAIKYRHSERDVHVRVSGTANEEYCVYSVKDNGIGMPESHQQNIFNLFNRLNPEGDVDGEGIGLTIVRRIVDNHNGQITVKSKDGEGTTFTVSLPSC